MSRELRFGFVGGVLILIWMTLTYLFHWDEMAVSEYTPIVSLIILIATIYLTILLKRDRDLDGFISFKDAFIAGISVSFVIGLMVGIYLLAYTSYVNPGYVDQAVKNAQDYLRQQNASQQEIDEAANSVRAKYSAFGQLTFGLGISMLPGVVIALICAAIMRREKKPI